MPRAESRDLQFMSVETVETVERGGLGYLLSYLLISILTCTRNGVLTSVSG